ncbi:MAG: hypothetical protein AAFP20_11815 [Cyanobacteria bacterium J06614_10]
MTLLGIRLTLLAGKTIPAPLPRALTESVASVEVTHSDEGRSGFQIVFQVGRDRTNYLDYPHLRNDQLKPFSRVIVVVTLGPFPQVLMDGIITHQQLSPSNQSGGSTLTVTGEDVSIMMDREEKTVEHPAQPEKAIATKIIAQYAQYGLTPKIIPPPTLDTPNPADRIPTQQGTDLSYLKDMARRYDYMFYVSPGPLPGTNTAYWGPSVRQGIPQKALSYNLGPNTNIESLTFQNDALSPTVVAGKVQDRLTGLTLPVVSVTSLLPALSGNPPDITSLLTVGRQAYRASGKNIVQAFAQAQAQADATSRDAVTAEGELNALKYGGVLQARALVGLRGVGLSYSGNYYVKKVTHQITHETYKQKFSLAREGTGSAVPLVRP